jgi:hypothetical protein
MFSFNQLLTIACLCLSVLSRDQVQAAFFEIVKSTGSVQVRRGLDEQWLLTHNGAVLREMDSIATGPESQVTLHSSEGTAFTLGANAMIDMADLRRITEQEMFLFIMSQKIEKLAAPGKKTGLEIGSVSVIHGDNKAVDATARVDAVALVKEMNGAQALQQQRFFTNAVVKYHKLLPQDRQPLRQSLIRYELGCCFEQLQQPGQALDAFQTAQNILEQQVSPSEESRNQLVRVQAAVSRLKTNLNSGK